ncbi:hypothetical protein ABK040_016309 [Willaertia magna]
MDNFQIYEEIGKGGSSVVYKGRKRKTIEYAAIKCIEKHHKQKVFSEAKILNTLSHPNVLKFFSWYETTNHYWIILEYCSGGDLLTLLSQDHKLTEESIHLFAMDIVQGLQYVHSKGVVYCDLKPSNILIDGCGILKLSGFGLAKLLKDIEKSLSSQNPTDILAQQPTKANENNNEGKLKRGTLCYTAPELLLGGVHSIYSDFWSLGCILYEMATGQPPFVGTTPEQTMDSILHTEVKAIENYSAEFNDLVKALLQKHPTDRLSWEEIREHGFWKEKIVAPSEEHRKYLIPSPIFINNLKATAIKKSTSNENVLRLSKIVQSNLEKELGPTYHERAPEKVNGKKITDMEYNFDESDSESGDDIPKEKELDEENDMINDTSSVQRPSSSKNEPEIVSRSSSNQNNVNTDTTLTMASLLKFMFNQSDSYVKPIIMNSRIEKITTPKYDKTKLPFEAHPLKKVLNMPQRELEQFLTQIYKVIGGNGDNTMKQNCLCYFETLCSDTQSANILVNSALMKIFVKMLKLYKSPMIRVRLCSVTGLLARHATYISGDLLTSETFEVFVELVLKDSGVKVKRRAIACLGELMFYVATQIPNQKENQQIELPQSVASSIIESLKSTDEVVQHYATKTIENISSQSTMYSLKFSTPECVNSLVQIFQSTKNEFLRGSAISSLSRMARNKATIATQSIDLITPKKFITLLKDSNIRVLQSALNIINLLLYNDGNSKQMKLLTEENSFEEGLSALIDHANYSIKAKALITYFLISKINTPFIVKSFGPKLCACIDRMMNKEKEQYVKTCLLGLIDSVAELISPLLNQIAQQYEKSNNISNQNKYLEFALLIMATPSLCERMINESVLVDLSKLLTLFGSRQGMEEESNTILLIIEALSRQPTTSVYHKVVVNSLLPSLLDMLGNMNGNVRFLCLKIFTDILVQFLNERNIYNIEDETHECSRTINDFIVKLLLPRYKQILDDQDPIPLYGLKLLNNIAEHNPGFIGAIHHFSIIPKLFEFFELEHRNNNVHNVRLILKVVNAEVLTSEQLYHLGIVPKLNAVLKYAFENGVDTFFEPCLGIVDNLLYKASKLIHLSRSKNGDTSNQSAADAMHQSNEPLIDNLQVYMKLCAHEDLTISESSCHVVLLIAQQYASSHEFIFSQQILTQIRKSLHGYLSNIDSDDSDATGDSSVKRICNYLLNILLIACQTNSKYIGRLKREEMLLIAINKFENVHDETLTSVAHTLNKLLNE